MLIASKSPPGHIQKTYFNLGRAAFGYLLEHLKPERIYLPSFLCWTLINGVKSRMPKAELLFYDVKWDLSCDYPSELREGDLMVFIHYFGKENDQPLPERNGGVIIEDISQAIASDIVHRGDHVFGSLRKLVKVADGGIILGEFHNPVYENGRDLSSWLRHEAIDWRDLREAENMIDREWFIKDISSQSLEVLLHTHLDLVKQQRWKNERYLFEHIQRGYPLQEFLPNEAPHLHNRIFEDQEERDWIRKELSKKGIFTSIHWPAHEDIRSKAEEHPDAVWLGDHILSIPVSQDFNLNDMESIVESINDL